MIYFYNVDKELYYALYVCSIDIHGEWEDYDITPLLVKNSEQSFDEQIGAYRISNDEWEKVRKELDNLINSEGYFRTYDEERYYEIDVAVPIYKVYDSRGELMNEDWPDTLEIIKRDYLEDEYYQKAGEIFSIVPYHVNECEFRPRLLKWSGKI